MQVQVAAALQVAIVVFLLIGLIGGVLWSILSGRRDVLWMQQTLANLDPARVVTVADKLIDSGFAERLGDSTIRLVRVDWLLSGAALDDAFTRDPQSQALVMRRCQELPPVAFFSPEEAKERFLRGDRSVIALSYCWLTALHPDPHGATLSVLLQHLREATNKYPAVADSAIFVDFMSLPQKDVNGVRTADELEQFTRGLEVMSSCYASIAGTVVVQCKEVGLTDANTRTSARTAGSVDLSEEETHEAAAAHAAAPYNLIPYHRRGWPKFEEGVARLVVAHLCRFAGAELALSEPGRVALALPWPKLVEIDGQKRSIVLEESTPAQLLQETLGIVCDHERVCFCGRADRQLVAEQLVALEWIMRTALDEVLEVMCEAEAEPDPQWLPPRTVCFRWPHGTRCLPRRLLCWPWMRAAVGGEEVTELSKSPAGA